MQPVKGLSDPVSHLKVPGDVAWERAEVGWLFRDEGGECFSLGTCVSCPGIRTILQLTTLFKCGSSIVRQHWRVPWTLRQILSCNKDEYGGGQSNERALHSAVSPRFYTTSIELCVPGLRAMTLLLHADPTPVLHYVMLKSSGVSTDIHRPSVFLSCPAAKPLLKHDEVLIPNEERGREVIARVGCMSALTSWLYDLAWYDSKP